MARPIKWFVGIMIRPNITPLPDPAEKRQGRQYRDWSADYRFYSHDRCEPELLFDRARRETEQLLPEQDSMVVAMDDSILRKTGQKIHGVSYRRDPLGPPFHVNFVRAQRFVQLSMALPQGSEGAARMIPVDFQHAPTSPKPRKTAPKDDWDHYKQESKKTNINRVGVDCISRLRKKMDRSSSAKRTLIVGVDGRFTNKTVLKNLPPKTIVVGRVRKDAQFHYLPEEQTDRGRKKIYGLRAPTPEQLRQDPSVPWKRIKAYAAGKVHSFKIKTLEGLRTRMRGAVPVRVIVIAPLAYRLTKSSKVLYRQPAYLICTDHKLSLKKLLQDYLWRWGIEVNFRDQKTLLGLGQAQVRNVQSNQNLPAMSVASYALLLLASVKVYGTDGQPDAIPLPKWRGTNPKPAVSTNRLINQLRHELWADSIQPHHFSGFSSSTPSDQNPEKSIFALNHALFSASA